MRSSDLFAQHVELTRRYFLQLGAAASAALLATPDVPADDAARNEALDKAIAQLEYFTPPDCFGTVERGTPLPYTHPIEKLREVGMTREIEGGGDAAHVVAVDVHAFRMRDFALRPPLTQSLQERDHVLRATGAGPRPQPPSPVAGARVTADEPPPVAGASRIWGRRGCVVANGPSARATSPAA